MKESKYYNKLGNWDFSNIKYKTKRITNWEFYDKIKEYATKDSLCLDIGTGGGEKTLKYYPNVRMIIATDYSEKMIETANQNKKNYPEKNIRFCVMDNLKMTFPKGLFDVVSARHTVINAKQIHEILKEGGVLIIEGVDKKDCIELKDIFGKGQAYFDEKSISEIDYQAILEAGFKEIEKVEIYEEEYYETEDDLIALLLKAPILGDFLELEENPLDINLLRKYINTYKTEKGILLKRVSYGIIAKK